MAGGKFRRVYRRRTGGATLVSYIGPAASGRCNKRYFLHKNLPVPIALRDKPITSRDQGWGDGTNPVKKAILGCVRFVLLAFSLAGFAYAQDVSLVPNVGSAAATARTAPATEPADVSGMLAAHNQARERLGLKPLSWSADLTDTARATARAATQGACTMASSANAVRGQDVSLHWASALRRLGGVDAVQDLSASYVVSRWREGRSAYDAAGGSCQGGSAQCGAYARIVAPGNREIGCARLICPSQAQVWVCHYRK